MPHPGNVEVNRMGWRRLALVVLLLGPLVQWGVYGTRLPERMASHFDGSGAPNAWSSPTAFFLTLLAVELVAVVPLLFVGPWLRRQPDSAINLPNKAYWLAPERREQALEKVARALLEFGIMTQLLVLYAVQLALQANLGASATLSPDLRTALAVYFVVTALWLVRVVTDYRLPGTSSR